MCLLPERTASGRAVGVSVDVGVDVAVDVAVGVASASASAWLFCSESGQDNNKEEDAAASLEDEVEGGGAVTVEEEPEEEVEAAVDSGTGSVGPDAGAGAVTGAGEEVDGVGAVEGAAVAEAAEGLSMSTAPSAAWGPGVGAADAASPTSGRAEVPVTRREKHSDPNCLPTASNILFNQSINQSIYL